jgi:hypothetical protein
MKILFLITNFGIGLTHCFLDYGSLLRLKEIIANQKSSYEIMQYFNALIYTPKLSNLVIKWRLSEIFRRINKLIPAQNYGSKLHMVISH